MLTQLSLGTSVLVVETEDNSVYLAADALQTETLSGRSIRMCKIVNLGGTAYWAAASNFYKTNAGFSVEEIVASVGAEGTIDSKMQRFIAAVSAPLARQVALIEKVNPKEYANYLAHTHTPLEIAFVGFENGRSKWAVTRFYVKRINGKLVTDPYSEPRGKPNVTTATGVGFWRPAADYVTGDLSQFYSDPTKTLVQGLEKAASVDPYKGVGGPYAVLRIDANGPTWTQRGECSLD